MPKSVMRIADQQAKALPRHVNFTVALLSGMTCPAGKGRTWIYDKTPGLACMVTETGARSFYVYRKVQGRPVRVRLGGFPDITIDQARRMAAKTTAEIAQGIDPMEQRRSIRDSITLQELFDRYTKDHAQLRATERTRITDASRFDTCFEDWKGRKLASIRPDDVRNKHTDLGRRRGQITANRAIQMLRRMFNFAKIEPNPARKGVVEYFREHARSRFLNADELQRLFKSLDAETNDTIRDYVKMSLWTGARRSNALSMRWDEIDLKTMTWTIPASKSKSGEPMEIHLASPAMEILEARKDNGSEYVFPGRRNGKSGHLVEPKASWNRILTAANIVDLRLHDLRRTLGSWQAAGGSSLQVIGKSLGHHDIATTAIYARLDLAPVRQSVDRAAAAMMGAAKPMKQAKRRKATA